MQGKKFGETNPRWLTYQKMKEDLRESHQEEFNWLFEEIEMQFLNVLTIENEEERKEFARKYYKNYLLKLSIDENPTKAELGKFGLDLLYLQFPDL